mgnify:CR=1 FL=1
MTRRGRRGGGNELVVIYWRDIPAQVSATDGDNSAKLLLDQRFQLAIDRAAGVAGLIDGHAYVAQWRRDTRPLDGDPSTAAAVELARLDEAYPRERLRSLVRNGGLDTPTDTDEQDSAPDASRQREEAQ